MCSDLTELDSESESMFHVAAPGSISLQTIVVNLSVGGASKQVVALLDSGSQATCIDEDLATRLNLKTLIGPTKRKVGYADRIAEMTSKLIQFEISSLDGLTSQTMTGWTLKDLASKTGIVDWSQEKSKFEHLRSLPFPKLPSNAKISIIIGTSYPSLYCATKVVSDPKNKHSPVALLTPLGWSCVGTSLKKQDDMINYMDSQQSSQDELIDTMHLFAPMLMSSGSNQNTN